MKTQPNPIRKLCLAITLTGSALFAQNVWACEKPQVSGYDEVWCLAEGLAEVKKDDKWGFLDKTGKVVIPLQYDHAHSFSEGLAGVKKDGKWGFIDKTGKVVIPLQYYNLYSAFKDGKAEVGLKDDKTPLTFYIDKTGKVLTTRTSLAKFRQNIQQGDDVLLFTPKRDFHMGMILEIKGNLVQVQITEHQCTQRDYKENCVNSVENLVEKWVKRSEIYPITHF